MMQDSKEVGMPHVDEGTLHAYLDGELPSTERKALETHLAECASCRATLAEERALLERATALLGTARPAERAMPPFEQLRPRSPKRSPWRVRTPVAWAASIALALGLGYFLRQPTAEFAIAPPPPAPEVALMDRFGSQADANKPESAPVRAERQAQQPARAPTSKTSVTRAESTGLGAEEAGGLSRQRIADSLAPVGRSSVVVIPLAAEAPQLRNAAPAPTSVSKVNDSLALQEAIVVSGVVASRRMQARLSATTTSWPIISRGTARSLLGTEPVGLPGLARQIRRNPANDGSVVVEQRIDSATTIQIFQGPAGADYYYDGVRERDRATRKDAPSAVAAPADRLARYVGKLRVEIAGPLSADSLNRLLDQVQPLP